ncbi:MAG: glycosyltransferase family 4 protein [Oculatellaceae cyanobacterium Prado106]|jgi:glycosyltransferase involved in cell wall biosynthesis|nr:glycosyltransferase family 4 protein [Oculatellaceae cyanobacterium Prado106]
MTGTETRLNERENNSGTPRVRVLLLADYCNPDWPSLPILAYRFACAMSQYADVTVVTQIRNQPNIDREGMGSARVVYIDTEWFAGPLSRLSWFIRGGESTGWTTQMAMEYPSYLVFEAAVWKRFKQDLLGGQFDLVHRITPMSPTLPSFMAKHCPVPFLIGPLNGALPWPKGFQSELLREREWLTYFRGVSKHLPFYRSTYHHASGILAAHAHTIQDLPAADQPKAINFPDTGYEPTMFYPVDRSGRDRLTILFAGRLVPYKLPEVVVKAFAKSAILQQHRLVIIGDGPERPRLDQIVAEHQIDHAVEFVSSVPYDEFPAVMQQADIFAFPSIRELGGGVVVEAMASGLACVVVDYGGPGVFIDGDRGVKVPLGDQEQLVQSYIAALEELVQNPERIAQLGTAAHQHVLKYYAWESKIQKMLEVYDWMVGRSLTKPDYWQQPSLEKSLV